ncbi:MAG TPA: SH3 domain-containing protein [Chthoniobacterales bacterium]|nr:SH3 domain-containing protein [Chthoniobacterales bacterium]
MPTKSQELPQLWRSSSKRIGALVLIVVILSATSAFSQIAVLNHNSNLRKSANSSSEILEELSAGTQVTLISKRKRTGYYHIRTQNGAAGWVWARNATMSAGGETSPTPAPGGPATGKAFDPGCTLPFDSIKQKHPIIDDSCSIDGEKKGGSVPDEQKLVENHAKNNFCLTGTPTDISYHGLLELEAATKKVRGVDLSNAEIRKTKLGRLLVVNDQKIGEGNLVRLTIYVIHNKADYADTGDKGEGGESVNCNRLSNEENDIHIPLAEKPTAAETVSVTVEMSPHFRPPKWTPEQINAAKNHPIRVVGQLFYDSAHRTKTGGRTGAPRASLWEIHPVYQFEVCTLGDVGSCTSRGDSVWKPLDQFQP